MQTEDLIARVDAILIDEFELDPADLRPEARLREDLDLDSLDGMDLLVALENDLGLRVDERRLLALKTVGEVHALLREVAADQPASPSAAASTSAVDQSRSS